MPCSIRFARALTAGALAATAALSAPVSAQDQAPEPVQSQAPQGQAPRGQARPAQEAPQYNASRGFTRVYEQVSPIANATTGDFAAARAQVPALLAAIENADDRFLAGNVTYVLGNKLSDRSLQQQGLELMLASGKAPAAAVAEINYFLGEWAYDAQQWARARQYLTAALAAGYTQGNAAGLIVETHFHEGQHEQGVGSLETLVQQRASAGQEVPEAWLRRGLQAGYDAQNVDLASKWAGMLVDRYPTTDNWTRALQLVGALQPLEPQAQLDLLRLMALTNTLSGRDLYARYVAAADPRVMATEVSRVLAAGAQAGVFGPGDEVYDEAKRVSDERAPAEAGDAARYAAEARGSASGRAAENAGELFLALQSYPQAEEMFKLALEKGGIDRDAALTRLGIAQVQQGKLEEARASFQQVSGTRAVVAKLWSAYAASKA